MEIFDTTLRDGTQREGLSLSVEDKIAIARRLDRLGISYIEGGWPGSNPKDAAFFERAREIRWEHARIAAFGSTRRVQSRVEEDANLAALLEAGTPVCALFGKSWLLHVTDILRTTAEENLRMIEESVAYLVENGRTVIYDAEHFFDGYRADRDYALETLKAAARGGAEVVVLCDTNGGTMPWDIEAAVKDAAEAVPSRLGIHAHDDAGCGVANSVTAVRAGATHVQGTINGYGERCGNANLCAIIPNLELKLETRCLPRGSLPELLELSRFVAETANLAPDEHMPYVGRCAFSHKGGVHVSAIRRDPRSYSHVDPEVVGNEMRVVVSELSGRGNLQHKAEEHGVNVAAGADLGDVLAAIKENEARGFSYEAADGSIALLVARRDETYEAPFHLVDYMVSVQHRDGRGTFSEATVKVKVAGEEVHTAADGDGPVNALDQALRKALLPIYPRLADIKLVDYKVRILDGDKATSATTRVLVESSDGRSTWGTVGASQNIIEASWRALSDAVEYGLLIEQRDSARPAAQIP